MAGKPKKKCCVSTPRCTRCPLRMLAEGTLPDGFTVRHRRLVKVGKDHARSTAEAPTSGSAKAARKAARAATGKSGAKAAGKPGKPGKAGKARKKDSGRKK